MKKASDRLLAEFRCPKCRSREAVSREVVLAGLSERVFGDPGEHRYLLASCALCGYTEIYNLQLYVQAEQSSRAKNEAEEPAGP